MRKVTETRYFGVFGIADYESERYKLACRHSWQNAGCRPYVSAEKS